MELDRSQIDDISDGCIVYDGITDTTTYMLPCMRCGQLRQVSDTEYQNHSVCVCPKCTDFFCQFKEKHHAQD